MITNRYIRNRSEQKQKKTAPGGGTPEAVRRNKPF
nr:MAG TPA: hypothetical protein [Caudoviricetes sp.]